MASHCRIQTYSFRREYAVDKVINPAEITSDGASEGWSIWFGDATPASVAASRIKMTGAGFGSGGGLDSSLRDMEAPAKPFPRV